MPDLIKKSHYYTILNETPQSNDTSVSQEQQFAKDVTIFTGASFLLRYLCVLAWFKVGSSANVKLTVIPLLYLPEEISPLAARYILRQGNVDGIRMVTIALMSTVTKCSVKIFKSKSSC